MPDCPNRCLTGWVEVNPTDPPTHPGTFRPCEVCAPNTYAKWSEAKYQRGGRDRPPELPLREPPDGYQGEF